MSQALFSVEPSANPTKQVYLKPSNREQNFFRDLWLSQKIREWTQGTSMCYSDLDWKVWDGKLEKIVAYIETANVPKELDIRTVRLNSVFHTKEGHKKTKEFHEKVLKWMHRDSKTAAPCYFVYHTKSLFKIFDLQTDLNIIVGYKEIRLWFRNPYPITSEVLKRKKQ